ncbi:17092_t:CDS:2, partial [Funneliformis geosporum]
MDIEIKEEFKNAKEELEHATEELKTFRNKKQERLYELLLKMANEEERNDHQKKYWGIMIDELREEKARLNNRVKFFMDQMVYYRNKLTEFNNNAVKRKSETVSSEEDVDRRASDRIKK